jgi:DNA-binding PadR family transcriptional regulator
MKSAPTFEEARELKSILVTFAKVRILHYASEAPTTAASIAGRLGWHGGSAKLSPILASLVRSGLMRAKANPARSSQQYSLTPSGRRWLATAKKHLRRLST